VHRIAGETVGPDAERELILVEHPPARVLFISTADTDLILLEQAWNLIPDAPSAAFVLALPFRQPASADAYVRDHVATAETVVLRLLGGSNYYPHLLGAIENARAEGKCGRIITLSADAQPDETYSRLTDLDPLTNQRLDRLFLESGPGNTFCAARWIASLPTEAPPPEMVPVPMAGISCLKDPQNFAKSSSDTGHIWVLFYRAFELSGDLEGIKTLCSAITRRGLYVTPIFAQTLRDSDTRQALLTMAGANPPSVILCLHQFSLQDHGGSPSFLERLGVPVLQLGASRTTRALWAPSRPPSSALSPSETATQCALPELDGRVFSGVALFREPLPGTQTHHHPACVFRCEAVAREALRWHRLQTLPNHKKRIVILLSNYPISEGRIGNGVGLDTPESALRLLHALAAEGYETGALPSSSSDLMQRLLEGITNDFEASWDRPARQVIPASVASDWLAALPAFIRDDLAKHWSLTIDENVPIAGVSFGNVFVGIQPPRGFNHQNAAVYHSPELPPPPSYLLYYQWLREEFCADAVVHLGKHGNLEWLPGRAIGLDETDYPHLALQDLPNFYPFIVNDPGEGTQAKRRTHAVIIDHLTPPLMRAGLYGELEKLETLLEEHARAESLFPQRASAIEKDILAFLAASPLSADLPGGKHSVDNAGAFLCDLKESRVRNGLHILGEQPSDERLIDFICSVLECGSATRPGLSEAILGAPLGPNFSTSERDAAAAVARSFVAQVLKNPAEHQPDALPHLEVFGNEIRSIWLPRLRQTSDEMVNLLAGLSGRFVPPGASGSPTRGRADTLPTGRNFYSIDPRVLPTPSAWRCGKLLADRLLERHFQEHGESLRTAALVIWGTSNMRTGGDDIAQALWLWGCEPVWEEASGRLVDVTIIPASVLARPRVDLTIRISGLFRDAFGETARLLATIPQRLALLDEPNEMNPIRASVMRSLVDALVIETNVRRAALRVFSPASGNYGAGVLQLLQSGNWSSRADVAEVFLRWGNHAMTPDGQITPAEHELRDNLTHTEAVIQNQDNRDHDILDSDDYFQFQGGLAATIETLRGREVPVYHGDSSRPESPVMRTLSEEMAKVIHSRVLNPRWIEGMRRHGYKGAFEMAATVDYLFGYAMTTDAVKSHHFDSVAKTVVIGQQEFFREHNRAALKDCSARLLEAHQRHLWKDAPQETLADLTNILLTEQLALE
jgi:cobaltochelatase CobN